MPKLGQVYTVHLNLLVPDDGTREVLIAMSYFRYASGEFGAVARDLLTEGIERFRASLSPKDKAAFAEIENNVKAAEALKKS